MDRLKDLTREPLVAAAASICENSERGMPPCPICVARAGLIAEKILLRLPAGRYTGSEIARAVRNASLS
jgi:hypothetical protein